jgi:hypothetical protein
MKAKVIKEQKTAFWRRHIELANEHPDGIQKYCDLNGLASQTYYKWKLKLDIRKQTKRSKQITTQSFAAVQVFGPEVVRSQGLPDAHWLAEFILRLGQGL